MVSTASTRSRSPRMPRQQRREQLLEVATQIFTAHGYHNASMDEIAEAAGVSKPVLYQHFNSKLELYLALVDQTCDDLVDAVQRALDSTDENKDRVRAAVGALYAFVSDSERPSRLVFESDLNDPEVQQRLWRTHSELARSIGTVIAQDTGLPDQRAILLGMSLVGMAELSARHYASDPGGLTLTEASDLVSTLAWRGIRTFPKA